MFGCLELYPAPAPYAVAPSVALFWCDGGARRAAEARCVLLAWHSSGGGASCCLEGCDASPVKYRSRHRFDVYPIQHGQKKCPPSVAECIICGYSLLNAVTTRPDPARATFRARARPRHGKLANLLRGRIFGRNPRPPRIAPCCAAYGGSAVVPRCRLRRRALRRQFRHLAENPQRYARYTHRQRRSHAIRRDQLSHPSTPRRQKQI